MLEMLSDTNLRRMLVDVLISDHHYTLLDLLKLKTNEVARKIL